MITLRSILRTELNEDSSKAISIVSKSIALQLTPNASIVKKTVSIMKNLIKKFDTSRTHAATVSQIVDCYIEISAASMELTALNAKMRDGMVEGNRNPFWSRIKSMHSWEQWLLLGTCCYIMVSHEYNQLKQRPAHFLATVIVNIQ